MEGKALSDSPLGVDALAMGLWAMISAPFEYLALVRNYFRDLRASGQVVGWHRVRPSSGSE